MDSMNIDMSNLIEFQHPLVSIIMPLYNCETFVSDSIISVIEQTYENWELIIVDDVSTDNSFKQVKQLFGHESRIRLYQMNKNSGAAATRNHAIELSHGQFISFLDSDDLWVENKLEMQVSFMQEHDLVLSFSTYWLIDEKGKVVNSLVHAPPMVDYKDLLKKNTIGCLTAMYDKRKLGKRYFDTTLTMHEDYQYWLEILKGIDHAYGMNIPLAYHRIRSNSLSRNKIEAAHSVWKILREYQKIPFIKALYYFIHYAVSSLVKYGKPIT